MSDIYSRIRELSGRGLSLGAIAREVGCYDNRVASELKRMRQGLPPGPPPSPQHRPSSAWTDARVGRLSADWASGYSARQCAERLGGFAHCVDGGRSAVIGKIHRLGLSARSTAVRKAKTVNRTYGQRKWNGGAHLAEQVKAERAMRVTLTVERQATQSLPDLVIPINERRQFVDLEPGDCRWSFGDPRGQDFHFCSGLQEGTESRAHRGKHSYCRYHGQRAFAPPAPRRINSSAFGASASFNEQQRSVKEFDEMERA